MLIPCSILRITDTQGLQKQLEHISSKLQPIMTRMEEEQFSARMRCFTEHVAMMTIAIVV